MNKMIIIMFCFVDEYVYPHLVIILDSPHYLISDMSLKSNCTHTQYTMHTPTCPSIYGQGTDIIQRDIVIEDDYVLE